MNSATVPANPLNALISVLKKIAPKSYFTSSVNEKTSVEAYDIWAETYDAQPGNLMLDMDEVIFSELLGEAVISNKQIADIGCGTGRHWTKIFDRSPANITGFDVSAGMLNRLEKKFPQANTIQITDNNFLDVRTATYDMIISTLTVAHIENINEALTAWSRILKPKGDIIITDFHPNALAFGGKRTFNHNKASIAIQNFVHYVADIEEIMLNHGFHIINKLERTVDESVRHYYEAKNALDVYERFKDSRIIYGVHLQRGNDI